MLALALWNSTGAQAAPLVDMQQSFDGINDATMSGTSTTQNGHTGAWISGYSADTWATGSYASRDCLRALTDSSGGLYGAATSEPIDNHFTYNAREWRDFTYTVLRYTSSTAAGQDTVGVVFRWTDASNYYLAFSSHGGSPAVGTGGNTNVVAPTTALYRVRNGTATQLGSTSAIYFAGWSRFQIVTLGSQITVSTDSNADGDFLDTAESFTVTDGSPLSTIGRVGLYCYDSGSDGCAFDDLNVTISDVDADGDSIPDARDNCVGYGNPTQSDFDSDRIGDTCEDDDGDGQSEQQGDCNDTNKAIYKGAPELCDSVDSDCDGDLADTFVDTDADKSPDCVDADDDGDGVADVSDCKSLDKTIYPGAVEVCDGIDQDCDADVVETFKNFDGDTEPDCVDLDDDNDGSADTLDCDDADKSTYPGAAEACDLVDSNCNSSLVDTFLDTDLDKTPDCVDLDDDDDLAPDTGDCNPTDKTVYPGAAEACDAVDSDCDGSLVDTFPDTDSDANPDCVDLDDDGDGTPDTSDCGPLDKGIFPGAVESACDAIDSDCDGDFADGAGQDFDLDTEPDCVDTDDDNDGVSDVVDCNDFDAGVYPSAPETCDLVDSNCDGSLVDGALDTDADKTPDCVDVDDDGDGSIDTADCAPLDKTRFPAALEVCDTIDSNCNGSLVDTFADTDTDKQPDCTDTDDDADGLGDSIDCAPLDKTIFPGQTEVCDLIDSDCDGSLVDAFVDTDVDKTPDCVDPDDDDDGETDGADCAPTDAAISHAAIEVCNAVDDDCSGVVDDAYAADALTWYLDVDADGAGDSTVFVTACKQPAGYASLGADCDDSNKAAHPGGLELCTPGDEDCDGFANDRDLQGAADASTWAYDGDSDVYGDPANTVVACVQPDGYTDLFQALDCDDTNPYVNPDAPEVCNNGFDDDCDDVVDKDAGQSSWWPDGDGDGFGDASEAATVDCEPPDATTTWVHDGTDCDDADADVSPAAGESHGNGVDDDCDPSTPDVPDTGDTGETDPSDTDTPAPDTDRDSDRPYDSLTDTAAEPSIGEACGCAHGSAPGAALFAMASLLVVRRSRKA